VLDQRQELWCVGALELAEAQLKRGANPKGSRPVPQSS
jgi:hypothetical protein